MVLRSQGRARSALPLIIELLMYGKPPDLKTLIRWIRAA